MDHESKPQRAAGPSLGVAPRRSYLLPLLTLAALGAGGLLLQAPTHGLAKPIPGLRHDGPDLMLVVTGQMHGYIGPCGCSSPQYGGLVRRYTFIEKLKDTGVPIVGLDLGELIHPKEGLPQQKLLKLQMSLKALDVMGYQAVGIGQPELAMNLADVLVSYSANHPLPRPLALNLADAARPQGLYYELNARPWSIIDTVTVDGKAQKIEPRLGVFNVIASDLQKAFEHEKYLPAIEATDAALKAFAAAGVEMGVLLFQEYPQVPKALTEQPNFNKAKWIEEERHKRIAKVLAYCEAQRQRNPRIPPIGLALNLTDEPEPPAQLLEIKGSTAKVLEIGHKGRFLGVVGVHRKAAGLDLKYELVSMGPELDRPGQEAKNRVLALMEDYTRQVQRENLLAKTPRTPHHTQIDSTLQKRGLQARFVGSERCAGCHQHAATVWANTRHAHAFESLEKKQHPSLQQYDPECVVCHTVGFRHPTGYYDPPQGVKLEKHNAELKGVGCESCHGPGSAHANNPNDETLYPLINPFRPSPAERAAAQTAANPANAPAVLQRAQANKERYERARLLRLDFFCQKCHDTDNDVNWSKVPFTHKWAGGRAPIVHTTPRNQVAAPPGAKDVPAVPTGQKK